MAASLCFGCGVVHRGHCRFAAVGGVLPRAATGPSNVVSAFFLGEERNIHRAAHARIVDAALIEAFTAGPDRLLEQRADLHPSAGGRSEEHTSELQSLMRFPYAVFCLKKKTSNVKTIHEHYMS